MHCSEQVEVMLHGSSGINATWASSIPFLSFQRWLSHLRFGRRTERQGLGFGLGRVRKKFKTENGENSIIKKWDYTSISISVQFMAATKNYATNNLLTSRKYLSSILQWLGRSSTTEVCLGARGDRRFQVVEKGRIKQWIPSLLISVLPANFTNYIKFSKFTILQLSKPSLRSLRLFAKIQFWWLSEVDKRNSVLRQEKLRERGRNLHLAIGLSRKVPCVSTADDQRGERWALLCT